MTGAVEAVAVPDLDPVEPAVTITEPGVYYDLAAKDYHAQHEWLSWSRMKHLIPPSTPAHFKASLGQAEARKRHFDLGKVIHHVVLGKGDEYEVVQAVNKAKETVDATAYTTVSAQKHRDEIYDAGRVPILRHELEAARTMAAAIDRHPVAKALLSDGRPEVSLFWIDEATGVKCRARIDWLPEKVPGRRLIVPDLKSADSAAPEEFRKAAASHGYWGQQQHYSDGIRACGLDNDPAFLFVVVEKTDPWPVIVGQFAEVDDTYLARKVVDRARRVFRECVTTDTWPAYPGGVIDLSLPTWLHYQLEEFVDG